MPGFFDQLSERLRTLFYSRGQFFMDVTTVLSGALISRVIAVLAIPILARIYTPSEFGLLAVFMTINAIASAIACLRFEMAIVLPEDDGEAYLLLKMSLVFAAITAAFSFGFFMVFGDHLAVMMGVPELNQLFWLSALSIWLIGVFNACQSWASRTGQFLSISKSTVGGTLGTVVSQILLGLAQNILTSGLVIGQALGRLVQSGQLYLACRTSWARLSGVGFSFSRCRALFVRYKNFPLYDSLASLLNASSRELPVLMLGLFFTPAVIGYYSLGRRMLKVPMQLIDNAISRVFFPKAREEMSNGKLGQLVYTVFCKLAIIGVVPMLIVIVAAPAIVAVFLGPNWVESVVYIQWLSVWLVVGFIATPFAQLFNVLELQRARLRYQTVLMLARFLALLIGGLQQDPVLAVAAFSIVSAVISLLNCLWLLSKSGLSYQAPIRILFVETLYAVPFVAAAVICMLWFNSSLIELLCVVCVLAIFARLRMVQVLDQAYLLPPKRGAR